MVANYAAEHVSPGYDYDGLVEKRARPRRYESFVLRLWQDEGSDTMLRVELQHVQAGLSMEAVQVPLEWIVSEIQGCLEAQRSGQAPTRLGSDESR